jgi:putative SOS response-associated peptidase YedK
MIEHYALHEIQKLTDRFNLASGVPKGVKPRYNISPTQLAPVILQRGGETVLSMMGWGLVSQGAKDSHSVFRYKTFNVKSEKVFSKPVWDNAVHTQRCIIPANGFYMIRRDTGEGYYFTLPSQPLMALAGIYSTWTDSNSVERNMYTLLTIDSNEAMPLPYARMPVILHRADEINWINADMSDFSTLISSMRPYTEGTLEYRKVVDSAALLKSDVPDLLQF